MNPQRGQEWSTFERVQCVILNDKHCLSLLCASDRSLQCAVLIKKRLLQSSLPCYVKKSNLYLFLSHIRPVIRQHHNRI